MADELDGLFYNWRGKYYKGAMRDYKRDLREAAELRKKQYPTEHRNTKRHRLGQQKRGDYYCDECKPKSTKWADVKDKHEKRAATAVEPLPKRERRRKRK